MKINFHWTEQVFSFLNFKKCEVEFFLKIFIDNLQFFEDLANIYNTYISMSNFGSFPKIASFIQFFHTSKESICANFMKRKSPLEVYPFWLFVCFCYEIFIMQLCPFYVIVYLTDIPNYEKNGMKTKFLELLKSFCIQ